MKKRNTIKAIIFDIGGVLYLGKYTYFHIKSHRNGVHLDISKKLKISIDHWFDAIDSTYADAIEGKISEAKSLSIISKNLKINKTKLQKTIRQQYKKHFSENKELFKTALKFKKSGYKIAILSDQWAFSKEVLVHKKYYKKFFPVIISCDVGMRKPDMKIYKLTLKKLKLKPYETIFIDNRNWNLDPAKKLGMKTILFKNNKQTIRELKKIIKSK